ncbi:MAG: thiamine pyridinylase [Lachnospiraceae bacterium]|nr:thiamine pyridinylase [Lachnospiraceae bacterium]
MNLKNKKKVAALLSTVLVIFILSACTSASTASNEYTTLEANENISLSVALFPYVPDVNLFKTVISEEWEKAHPDVELKFLDWNCYDNKTLTQDDADVVTFDALYLTEYASTGQLLELDSSAISQQEDILEFVREGVKYDGKTYGAAQMICANLFFYREGDTELANVYNVDELYDILGENILDEPNPKEGQGLAVDLSSGTGNVCFYLDAIIDAKSVYTDFAELPDLQHINEKAVEGLNQMILMEGRALSSKELNWAKLFGQGIGKAYIGYSETMADMNMDPSQLHVGTLSLADREDIPLFYVDIVAVNNSRAKKMSSRKRELAIELVELMTSKDTMTKIISGGDGGACQYILPARTGCYDTLETNFPIYTQLKAIAGQDGNHVFRMGANAHDYIDEAKKVLPHYLLQ